MPVDPCGHEILDRSGTPSDEDLNMMREIAPILIMKGLDKNPDYGYQDFKNDVLSNPDLGPNYLNVMGVMYDHGVQGYRNNLRMEGMPILKDDPAQFMPAMDSFYVGHDADAVKTIFNSMTRIVRSGELKKARGGYDVMPDAELDRLAALVTPEELADPTDTRAQVVRARKIVLDAFPTVLDGMKDVVSDLEGKQAKANSTNSNASVADRTAADLAVATAKAHLDLADSMHDIVRTVQSRVLTHLARSLRAAQELSSKLRIAVPEAREFYDTFPGRLDEPLPLPADHEAIAEVNPYSPTMKSSYKDFLMAAGVEPPEYPRIPRPTKSYTVDSPAVKQPQTSEANRPVKTAKEMTKDELYAEFDRVSAQAFKEEAAKAKAPGAQRVAKPPKEPKTAPGVKAFNDSIRKIAKDEGKEVAKKRREEYQQSMSSAFDRFWSNTPKGEAVKTNQKGYTLLPTDILPTESLNALKDMVTETAKFAGAEFSDVYRMMRDTTGVNLDWNGPNGERVNHVEALAMAYEKAFPGKEVPKKIIESLHSENRAESEAAYKEIMSQTGDSMPSKGQLFNPRVAELARQRLDSNKYVRPGDPLRGEGVENAMNYLGGFIFTSMKKQTGKTPTYGRWVHEMRAATGTDLTAVDLANTWEKMKEKSYVSNVKPKLDAKAKAMNDAAVRLSSEQFKQFKEEVAKIPADDPNWGSRWAHEYRKAKGSFQRTFSSVVDVVATHRALFFSHDISVILTHLAAPWSDPRRLGQSFQNMYTAILSGMDVQMQEAALADIRNPDNPMFEHYNQFGRAMFDSALTNESEVFSSQFVSRVLQESLGKTNITPEQDMGFGKGGKYKFKRLRRSGSVVELDLEGVLGFKGVNRKVGQKTAEVNPLRSKLVNSAFPKSADGKPLLDAAGFPVAGNEKAKKVLASGFPGRGLSYMTGGNAARGSTKVSFELHPGRQIARNIGASERHWTTMMALTRKAMFDAEFQRLTDMGLDPHLDHQEFQAAMDNIGIFTGSSNLSRDSSDVVKVASKVFSAPRYNISLIQQVARPADAAASVVYNVVRKILPYDMRTRIEDYKPSNKMLKQTPLHSDLSNKYYLARYMGTASRTQMWDMLGGMAAGTMMYAALGALMGGEVQLDPEHQNSLQVRFKNYSFNLPNSPVIGLLRFLLTMANPTGRYLAAPKGSSPRPGQITLPGQEGYKYNSVPKYLNDGFGGATKEDKWNQYWAGKFAPGINVTKKMITSRDTIGQPVYLGRLYDKNHRYRGALNKVGEYGTKGVFNPNAKGIMKDVVEDFLPLSPVHVMEMMMDQKATTKERIMGLFEFAGTSGRPTKFQKDPNYISY